MIEQKLSVFDSGWQLFADCRCKTTQILLWHEAARHGGELTLMDYILRLRCRRCRSPAIRTRITNGPRMQNGSAPINMQLTG